MISTSARVVVARPCGVSLSTSCGNSAAQRSWQRGAVTARRYGADKATFPGSVHSIPILVGASRSRRRSPTKAASRWFELSGSAEGDQHSEQ
jgi:hypothetical protein